jgi:translation initiation factor IF-2
VRKGVVVHTGALNALKHMQNDVDTVAQGQECGLSFADFSALEEGDQIKCLEVVEE